MLWTHDEVGKALRGVHWCHRGRVGSPGALSRRIESSGGVVEAGRGVMEPDQCFGDDKGLWRRRWSLREATTASFEAVVGGGGAGGD